MPLGVRCAACLSFDSCAETLWVWEGPGRHPGLGPREQNCSLVGVLCILQILHRKAIKATLSFVGLAPEMLAHLA